MKNRHIYIWSLVAAVLLLDQALKIWVKTHFSLGETVVIFDWFRLYFVENQGMAFGMTMGPKIVLTLFRLILSGGIVWFICKLIRDKASWGLLTCVALILAGAFGNIIDCMFYGLIFDESSYTHVAEFLPAAGGYAPFLHGKVVDMLYFPLFTFPNWVPFLGGEIFFGPVFNLADTAITGSIFALLIFYAKEFNRTLDNYFPKKNKKPSQTEK